MRWGPFTDTATPPCTSAGSWSSRQSHRSLGKEAPGPHAQERACCATADPAKTHTDRPYGKIERSILSIAPGEVESRSPERHSMGRLTGHPTRTRKPFWCYFPNDWDLCRRNCQKPRTYRNYAD